MSSQSDSNPDLKKNNQKGKDPKLSLSDKLGKLKISNVNLFWIFSISGAVILGLFLFSLKSNSDWIANFIGTLGGLASLLGILLALIQLNETKKDIEYVTDLAEATKSAADSTRQSIRRTLSIEQLAKYCEQIKQIQEKLPKKELGLVIHLTQELKEAIIDLKYRLQSLDVQFDENLFSDHITKIGMNLGFFRAAVEKNQDKYKEDEILKDFDNLNDLMLDIKSKLKN